MEISDKNLHTMVHYLQETLSPDVNIRKPAEHFLEGVEVNENYPVLLLHLVHKNEVDLQIRIAGSIAFKNYIKRNWNVEDDQPDRIHQCDRNSIKSLIVTLMLTSPDKIQKQLSDAISIIGKTDFPLKWPELITQMVEKFETGDFNIINGVLQTAHSLFKKYRYEFKSNELWSEIKYVLEKLAQPLTDLLVATMKLTETYASDVNALKVIYSSLVLVSKVFYSLNFQDLPEFFEDNMATWMNNFHVLLVTDVTCLATGADEDAGLMEQLKSQVCDNVALYAQKYDEEFRPYLPHFVTDIWSLLVSTGMEPKYDLLVSNALQFLSSVGERAYYRNLFESDNVLNEICEKVIIPNIQFRHSDQELFEDNPEEFIRRDIEGSDIDTRRRAACDLVNTLSQNFEQTIMNIFGKYIQVMLNKYAENPAQNWHSKDAALYLVTSLVSRGSTQKHGVTQTSQLVSLPQFCEQNVLPELARPNIDELPILKADAIKYIMTFRSVLPSNMVVGTLPQLVRHIKSESCVVHTYAACAIEKILVMRDKNRNNMLIVSSDDLAPLSQELLSSLFATLDKPVSEENEYIMRAIMRVLSTLQDKIIVFMADALPKLTEKLHQVAKNPSKPLFNHYLFETFSICIRYVCQKDPSATASFENILFPIFQGILQQDIQEFIPYVFQLLSLLMESTPPGNISEPYIQLLQHLLAPSLWERQANISPLVRLLRAYLTLSAPIVIAQDKLPGLLGVFQKLIASKANDHEGFNLMQSILQNVPLETLHAYNPKIFVLLFQRLQSSKTTKFVIGVIVFFCMFAIKFSPKMLISTIDGIQQQMFGMVLEKLFLTELQKVSGGVDRKIVACGVVKLLCDCPEMYTENYQKYWSSLLAALINFFEGKVDDSFFPDDELTEYDETPSFQTTNAKLNFANNNKVDPLSAVTEPRQFLVSSLAELGRSQPGRLPTFVNSMDQQSVTHLQSYLSKFGVQLV